MCGEISQLHLAVRRRADTTQLNNAAALYKCMQGKTGKESMACSG